MSAMSQHNGEPGASGSMRGGSSSKATAGSGGSTQGSSRASSGPSRPRFSHPHTPVNTSNVPLPPPPPPGVDANGEIIPTTNELIRLIDHVMPSGTHALQNAINVYPAILTLQTQLQAAIDREASPFVRSQLRQVVGAANVRAQVAQSRARAQGPVDPAGFTGSSDDDPGASRSGSAPVASSSASGAAAAVHGSAVASASANATTGNAAGPPPPTVAAAAAAAGGNHRAHQHAPEVGMPTRIYKLQFDARRIICCSQTSVIVGWDFCNGDPALEEVARFFATVE